MKGCHLFVFSFLIIPFFGISQQSIDQSFLFDHDKFSLSDQNQESIKNLAHQLTNHSELMIRIIGHTDQDGSNDYNQELSKKRAETVKEELISNGLQGHSISIDFLGETALIDESNDANAKQKNRRVEVKAVFNDYNSIESLISSIPGKASETKIIDASKDATLEMNKGTKVIIPSDAFCHQDGSPVCDDVVIKCKEAFTYLDMLSFNLSTRTDQEVIETGGMISIKAYSDDKELKLQEGKEITMIYPESQPKEGMNIFTSVETDNGIIWADTGEEVEVSEPAESSYSIKVDLTSLINYELEDYDVQEISFPEMVKTPRKMRKPYPPSERIYTSKKYKEVYQKYLVKLKAYEENSSSYPEAFEKWKKESYKRKTQINEFREKQVMTMFQKKIKKAIAAVQERHHNQCHDKLIKEVFGFVRRSYDPLKFDNWKYFLKAFQNETAEVVDQLNFSRKNLVRYDYASHEPEFASLLREVKRDIRNKKIEMGIVDVDIANYIVRSNTMGWHNVDRFIRDGQFAKIDVSLPTDLEEKNKDVNHYLVFNDYRVMIRSYEYNGTHGFKSVPAGLKAKLVSIKVEGKKAYLSVQEITTGKSIENIAPYKKSEIAQIKKVFETLES